MGLEDFSRKGATRTDMGSDPYRCLWSVSALYRSRKKVLCYIYHLHITTLGMGYVYLLHEKSEALTAFHLRSSRQR